MWVITSLYESESFLAQLVERVTSNDEVSRSSRLEGIIFDLFLMRRPLGHREERLKQGSEWSESRTIIFSDGQGSWMKQTTIVKERDSNHVQGAGNHSP
jgi:hypothetical protein